VIYEHDLADQILNRETRPEWRGDRAKMVESFPVNMARWDEYADVLRSSLRGGGTIQPATEFYAAHREEMDAGAVVTWEHRHRDDELSALQHAMNLKIRDEAAFWAECQNQPVQPQEELTRIDVDDLVTRQTNLARGVVPNECGLITAFTDVQASMLWWCVCAWEPDFTGHIIDYGAWPDQGSRAYYTLADARRTFAKVYAGDESAKIYAALTDLSAKITGREWLSADGKVQRVSRWCIDANWRSSEAAIKAFAARSPNAANITLTYGRGVKASQMPMGEWRQSVKWRTGPGWCWSDKPGAARGVIFDANLWKKRAHDALTLPAGSRGGLTLWRTAAAMHRMFGDQVTSERPIKTEALSRTVWEWTAKPGRDNHLWDCLVGNYVAAAICGLTRDVERITATPRRRARPRVTYMG
jgi:hypothetical protein